MDIESLKLKLQYLESELAYMNNIQPHYIKKFTDRLKDLNKTRLKNEHNIVDCEITSDVIVEHDEEIKNIYRTLMLKYHPDKNNDEKTGEIAQFINDCYKKGDNDSLIFLSTSGEYSKDIPDYLLKIKDTENSINNMKKTILWNWNISSCKTIYENLFCSDDEFIQIEKDEHDKLLKKRDDLLKINENLKKTIEIVNSIKLEQQNDIKPFNNELIQFYHKRCIDKHKELVDMKTKSNSTTPYKNYETELNDIINQNIDNLSSEDVQNNIFILNNIRDYYHEMYWNYRKLWFSHRML